MTVAERVYPSRTSCGQIVEADGPSWSLAILLMSAQPVFHVVRLPSKTHKTAKDRRIET
jgi:hypothetical protein